MFQAILYKFNQFTTKLKVTRNILIIYEYNPDSYAIFKHRAIYVTTRSLIKTNFTDVP